MCGIIGFQGGIDTSLFKEATASLRHRGPDDTGIFIDSSTGIYLGHQRLAIQDISTLGHQPMISTDSKVILVFNGEIYNFHELRTELEKNGIICNGNSDTEVLLNLYLAVGEKMLTKLNGIFAFAIWDARYQSLFIARDGFGIKPLYYSATDRCFAFASEIKALLQLIPEQRKLDPQSIHHYLTFLWCPGGGTPLQSVCKLLPGEAMVVREGQIERQWVWYQLPFFHGVPSRLDLPDSIDGTVKYLRQAVQRQMVADVPLGAFLSGGLDSSAVVAFAREVNPDIRCFTIEISAGQETGMVNDLPYARLVAKHLDISLDIVSISSQQMANNLERMVAMLDEPLADPASLNVLFISQFARKSGIKVLLSGAGGDDLFTGYRRHYAIQLEKYWTWLPQSVKNSLENFTKGFDARNSLQRRIAKLFNGASLYGDDRLINYFCWTKNSISQSLYSAEFRNQLIKSNFAAPMLNFIKPLSSQVSLLDRMLALEQRFFLADHNLTYTDKMSMAAGLEVRVPFLDLDLVDFTACIPTKYKQRGRVSKWVLKKAMEPYLPREVIYRPKTGFGAPLRRWMRFELRELLGDILSEASLYRRGIFDPQAVQKLIKNNDQGVVDASYTLLSLMCIEIWCRQFLDRQFNYQQVYSKTP